MRNFLKSLISIMIGCFGIACITTPVSFAAQPAISMPETTYSFGELPETTVLTHDFKVKNGGDAVLHIKDVKPDCGCTLAYFDKTIPAHGEGKVTLKLDLNSFQGYVKKSTAITTDDPANPRMTIFLEGTVKPLVAVLPAKSLYLQGMPDTVTEKVVDLVGSTKPFHITKVDSDLAKNAEYRLETVEEGKHYRVRISNRLQRGTYRGSINLHTDLAERPELTVWVNALIEGDVGVRPNLVVVGKMSANQPVISGKVLVVSNRDKPFKIVKCTWDEKLVRVEQTPFPDGKGFSLALTPNMENIPQGSRIQSTLTVETDAAPGEKYDVQVQAINLTDTK